MSHNRFPFRRATVVEGWRRQLNTPNINYEYVQACPRSPASGLDVRLGFMHPSGPPWVGLPARCHGLSLVT